ncbi:MAG: hypothetical protein K6F63_03945, partial [Lachnospiraceae bacterium]|nr:hypothetical protein [Lachnospiraceae bacterium]
MIIPEKIKSVVEETIKEIAESIAEATAQIEELKQKVEEKEQELETAYKILDMDKKPEAAPETKEEKPKKEKPKKAGRPKKKKEGDEMVTPTEQRSARQVVEHNKYMKSKAKKAAAENVIPEPITGSLEKINAEARAAGMSYGKYTAQEQIKQQHEEMERSRLARHMREAERNEREGILEPN